MSMLKQARQNVLAFFGMNSLPKKEGKYELSDEQKKELDSHVEKDGWAEKFLELANKDLESETARLEAEAKLEKLSEEQKKAVAELKKIAADNGIEMAEEEDDEDDVDPPNPEAVKEKKDKTAALQKTVEAIGQNLQQIKKERDALARDPEPDNPEIINANSNMKTLGHTATHVFGSGNSWDAIDQRPWNRNLLNFTSGHKEKVEATDWTDALNIDIVNRDLADYHRKELDKVVDVMGDFRALPPWWDVVSNVNDEIAYTALINGEITQGRKKKFLAKNRQKFVPIIGKVYPVQIDALWTGYQLHSIETSWMNRYNREGSQPHKMSFVRMLVEKLLEQARKEDNQVLIKGVYFPDEDAETPQNFIHRGKGLLQLIAENRNKTYRAFANGKPTKANIIDYVRGMCDNLPEEKRNAPDLVFYMSPTWSRSYLDAIRLRDGLNQDYKPENLTVEHYPNITIYPLDFMDGEDLMFITPKTNIMILENIAKEKSLINFQLDYRNVVAMGDYKIGIHVDAFGAQWTENDPVNFKNQIFWSNDVEVNTSTTIPIAPNDPTPSVKYHNVLKTGENTGATAITNLDDATDGQYYYIYGNSEGTASTIASGANFDLASSITLGANMMIKLYKVPNGKFTEISRKDLSVADGVILAPDATTADAADGTRFITSANTVATAFTDITNAVADTVYRIEGGSDANATTIAKAGKFDRISAAITLEEGNWIDVLWNGTSFVELNRLVA